MHVNLTDKSAVAAYKKRVCDAIDAAAAGGVVDALIQYDQQNRWFKGGDNEKTCPLLAFMMRVEYRSGTLVFIPDAENVANHYDRNNTTGADTGTK